MINQSNLTPWIDHPLYCRIQCLCISDHYSYVSFTTFFPLFLSQSKAIHILIYCTTGHAAPATSWSITCCCTAPSYHQKHFISVWSIGFWELVAVFPDCTAGYVLCSSSTCCYPVVSPMTPFCSTNLSVSPYSSICQSKCMSMLIDCTAGYIPLATFEAVPIAVQLDCYNFNLLNQSICQIQCIRMVLYFTAGYIASATSEAVPAVVQLHQHHQACRTIGDRCNNAADSISVPQEVKLLVSLATSVL